MVSHEFLDSFAGESFPPVGGQAFIYFSFVVKEKYEEICLKKIIKQKPPDNRRAMFLPALLRIVPAWGALGEWASFVHYELASVKFLAIPEINRGIHLIIRYLHESETA